MPIELHLLGGTTLIVGEDRAALSDTRPVRLLSYLAFQEGWVDRSALATLFWPEKGDAKAHQNLRALLYRCRRAPYADALDIEDGRVRCLATTDVQRFQEAVAQGEWGDAVDAYRGPFLSRVRGDDSSLYESWLAATRDDLHSAWKGAALQVAQREIRDREYLAAIALLETILERDFLAEDALQACMRAYARAGQRHRALNLYESFRARLDHELDLEPLTETLELAEELRTDAEGVPTSPPPAPTSGVRTLSPLPQPPTPFLGRALELFELDHLLKREGTHLLTLLGPGGSGKSRLGLQLLREQAPHFAHGVCFVPLAPLSTDGSIPDAVATALQLELTGTETVEAEIFGFLESKSMLIALDNVEHLPDAAQFVRRLLEHAPHCTLVCTSRVVLGLPNEIVYDLAGLSVPTRQDEDLETFDAARLFLRSARRVRSDFSLTEGDRPLVIELCRYLEGMPLALELAATWTRILDLPDLLAELRKDLDLLETSGDRVSERHRSLRRVFETSWQLLEPDEQRLLAALSIFRGGFDRQAVATIAGGSARSVLALVNASLLSSGEPGRFSLLEVVRQYAAEKGTPDHALHERHARYYLEGLAASKGEIDGDSPRGSLQRIERDLENVRSAWTWALEHGRFDLCREATEALGIFYQANARTQEALRVFGAASSALTEHPDRPRGAPMLLQAQMLYQRGSFSMDIDDLEAAERLLQEGLELARGLGDVALTIRSVRTLAVVCNARGRYDQALAYGEEALTLAESRRLTDLIVSSRDLLAMTEEFRGEFATAEAHYLFVLDHHRRRGQVRLLIKALNNYGCFLNDTGRPLEATPLFAEGLELAEHAGVRALDEPYLREGIGKSAFLLGRYDEALDALNRTLELYTEQHNDVGRAICRTILAEIHLARHDYAQATADIERAVRLSLGGESRRQLMTALLTWAEVLLGRGERRVVSELLATVIDHEASKEICEEAAKTLVERFELTLPPPMREGALNRTLTSRLDDDRPAEGDPFRMQS